MIDVDLDELRRAFGFGVAGNFAGHLEQAGEAADFARVVPVAAEAPKGIFPWYRPGDEGFLGTFPLSVERLELPTADVPLNLQIEPELGVIVRMAYGAGGRVVGCRPTAAGAFNDCSIRRPGATKISEKKNWGVASKGLAARLFAIDDLEADGGLRGLRIASFLRRGDTVHEYGIDSAAADYSYAGARLIDWILDRLANQVGAPDTPLEPVGRQLCASGCPPQAVVGIGATRYTAFGESNFLLPGDESVVVVYDSAQHPSGEVSDAVRTGVERGLRAASVLTQRVVGRDGDPASLSVPAR